jgi:NarL family two-component system sensor histidine kinase LiaS
LKKKARNNSEMESQAATAAVLEERQRISRELHDRVLQLLSSVKLRAEVCRSEFLGKGQSLERELETIEREVEKAITEIRNLLAENQNTAELKAGTLERRLRAELEIFRARTGFNINFQCKVTARDLPYVIEKELYFTLREAVLNAVRHSRASELNLSLQQTPRAFEATLRDNGVGFDLSSVEGDSHYGLSGMRERVQNVGGQFMIQTAPGKGTEISIVIPIAKKQSLSGSN